MIFRSSLFYTTLFIFYAFAVIGQQSIWDVGTIYDDRLDEWFITDESDDEGELEIKWKLRNDWTEWDYDIGDRSGTIKQKWSAQPGRWELRSDDGILVEFSTKWRNDWSEWRIKTNDLQIDYEMSDKGDSGFWVVDSPKFGYWEFYNIYNNDIRDWESYDELDPSVPFEVKMALVFISIIVNYPR